MKLELPSTIYSPQQVEALIARLQFFMVQVRQQAVKRLLKVAGAQAVTQTLDAELQDVIRRWDPKGELTIGSLEQLSRHLQTMLKETPIIHVTLAGMPSVELKRQLVTWLRQNLRPDLLIAFSLNSNLAGGIVLRTDSRIYDYSFRKNLLGHRDKLKALLTEPENTAPAVAPTAEPAQEPAHV